MKTLIYILSIVVVIRLFFIFYLFPRPAYYFPYFLLTEYSIGILIGKNRRKKKGIPSININIKKISVKYGEKVWPLYISHMLPIIFLSKYAPWWQFLILIPFFIILTELFYHLLNKIYGITIYQNKKGKVL
ncbi:MAG: hypothetical protein ACTSPY_18045 [Candidatus Helarchaeota archaeon]